MTVKCNKCKEEINKEDLDKNYYICPLCGKLNRMPAKNHVRDIVDSVEDNVTSVPVESVEPDDAKDTEEAE